MVGGRNSLARAQDTRELRRREQAMAIEDVTKYYGHQKFTDANTEIWKKDETKRRDREMRERQMEEKALEKLMQDHAAKQAAEQRSMEEGQIADAIAKQCTEQQRKYREIQAVREQSEELRELAEKIRTARVNKERCLQMREREILIKKEENFHAQFDKMMEKERCAALKKEKQYEAKKRNDNLQSRKVLEEQIQEKAEARISAQLEYDREKELIDEVVSRIQEEDALEAKIKAAKQEETKAYILEFLKQREEQRKEKIELEKQEDLHIAQYLESVQERESAEKLRRQALQDEADRIYTRLCQEKDEQARRIEEENDLLDMLREEEAEQKKRLEKSERLRKAEIARQETKRENEQQVKMKAEREAARKLEESQFRAKMLEKFAEDDRIDQLNAQRRRQKQIEHRHEVERLIVEKRNMYEALMRKEAEDEAARQKEDERKAALVENERKRLLEEAAGLQEYLPKGVIRDEEDKQYIDKLAQCSDEQNYTQHAEAA